MITTAFLNIIYGLLQLIVIPLSNLPDITMNSAFATSITTANGYISSFNTFIPLDTIGAILVLLLAIEGGVLTYKLIMWIIRRIPTQS